MKRGFLVLLVLAVLLAPMGRRELLVLKASKVILAKLVRRG